MIKSGMCPASTAAEPNGGGARCIKEEDSLNPEVLSLIKLAGVFAIIIGLLSMKKPLNLVMSIASIVVVVLYALPVGQVLPALKTGLIGSNTINAILVLYCITYLQRMMESRRQLAGCEEAMNGLFNNRRINASVVPFMLGCLPAASTVLICGPIVRSAVDDSLTAPETAAATTYFRHISEAFMPTYSGILIAISLTNGLVTPGSFVLGMLPVVVCLFISGYVIYLRRIPKETGLVYDQPKSFYFKHLIKSIWPIFLSIAMVLMLNTPVWGAVLVCIVLEFFVQKFTIEEIKPFFRTAFESKLMLNTIAVMIFGNLLRSTGVVDLLPVYLSKLPIPSFLVWTLIFAIGTLVGGSLTIYVLAIPMLLTAFPGAEFYPMFLLVMSASYIVMQVNPTHICLTLCAEDFKIPLCSLIAKSVPLVIEATALCFGYYFILTAFVF